MLKLLFVIFFSATTVFGHAQRLSKYAIGNSGCAVYMFCDPGEFKLSLSDDSSKVYTSECTSEGVVYGAICVKLMVANTDLSSAEDLVVAYLDYLKTSFEIKESVGYGRGNQLNNNEKTKGVIDYWKGSDNQKWKIKGWTNGSYIGVLYAHSKTELPAKIDVFLNSFRMPGM